MVFTKKIPPSPTVKFEGVPLKVTHSFVLDVSRDIDKERPD